MQHLERQGNAGAVPESPAASRCHTNGAALQGESIPDVHLSETDRHRVLVTWNDTTADFPREKCVHHLVEDQVRQTPDAVAIESCESQLTYRELEARADVLADELRERGVGTGVLVGRGVRVGRNVAVRVGFAVAVFIVTTGAGSVYTGVGLAFTKTEYEPIPINSMISQASHLL